MTQDREAEVQLGAGRTPLIVAGIAAVATYAAFGSQNPFGFLRHLGASPATHSTTVSVVVDDDDTDDAKSDSRALAPFDGIVLEDGAAADIAIGDTQSVDISAPGHHGEGVKTTVTDGKLVVGGMGPAAHLRVTVPHLRTLQVNGPSKVSIAGLSEPIAITANGPAKISASGTVDSADVTVNGPSKLILTDLIAKTVSVHMNGIGDAEVHPTANLNADIEGVGRVRYVGDPHIVSTIHGYGSIKRISDDG